MSYEEASMLLVGCSTVEFDVPAWVIPMCYPRLYSITLQCHDPPSAEARVIPPALLKIQLLHDGSEHHHACTALLSSSKTLIDIVCNYRLYRCLSGLEYLIKLIAIYFVFHIKLMFAVGNYIYFQIIMNRLGPVELSLLLM